MMTEYYAVVGNPIEHSRSPEIHHAFAAQTGAALRYERLLAEPDSFELVVRAFFAGGGHGLNVTVPFKEAACELADECTDRARRAGAVNTLKPQPDGRLLGENTDGIGLLTDLLDNVQVPVAGQRILIVGAGGAVRGVLPTLLAEKPESVHLVNRTRQRAEDLLAFVGTDGVRCLAGGLDDVPATPFDLIVNATSAGLHGDFPDLPAETVNPSSTCYDLVYAREPTAFMTWAKAHGAGRVVDGLGMLVEQAAAAYALWRGLHPNTAPVIQTLRAPLPDAGG